MSILTDLESQFRRRVASYMMVTILAMLDNVDSEGKAKMDDIIIYFKKFYEQRKFYGKKPEKDILLMSKIPAVSEARIKETLITNPVKALSDFITYRGDINQLHFTDKVLREFNTETKEKMRDLAYEHLHEYFKQFDPNQLTLQELGSLPLGVAVNATDVSLLSGQNQMKGIHPVFKDSIRAIIILCTIGGESYPNEWLNEDKTLLKYYLEGRTDNQTGKKTYNLNLPSNKAILESNEQGFPLYIFVRDKKGKLFHYAGRFLFERLEQSKGQEDFYFVLKCEVEDVPKKFTNKSITPSELIENVCRYISKKGFIYDPSLIKNFYLCLRTKPFIILAGISGTGKSKLAELFAEAVGATSENGQYTLIPVRPDWNDSSDLLGYKDIHGDFQAGPLTRVIEKANNNLDKPYFVCLDEMNLSRVEYYFSELLSLMETKKRPRNESFSERLFHDNSFDREEDRQKYGSLRIPPNLYVIGTVNMDETTFPFSKKVLDRANTLEFSEIDFNLLPVKDTELAESLNLNNQLFESEFIYLQDCLEDTDYINTINKKLNQINEVLAKASLHIGYRVRDEICFYMTYNKKFNLLDEDEAIDYEIMQKILPRIQGSSSQIYTILIEMFRIATGQNYTNEDGNVAELALKYVQDNGEVKPYPRTARKIATMLWRFEDGFTSFWL
ncbi:MAG: hypothetical protein CVU89_06515 [Firmicutes bacterium HGW-Firmicutes-14]|nr:MAG: hypothetical protein CVU89_06515 [Firmicutes bacterium HGW-Firmicutes-14]